MADPSDILFGIHAVLAALEADSKRVREIQILRDRKDQRVQKIVDLARANGVKIRFIDRKTFDRVMTQTSAPEGKHQGVLALSTPIAMGNEADLNRLLDNLTEDPFLLILDGVTDPHNLGACLRTADAAGIHAVITPRDKSASLNATAIKVACGAADTVPFIQVTNLARTLRDLQQKGIWLTGTAGEASINLYQANLKGGMGLIMGAEGPGMRRLTREHCDQLVSIPMAGKLSSLNVSVATGICLFEAVRQRQSGKIADQVS